jgi:hypothetical protein
MPPLTYWPRLVAFLTGLVAVIAAAVAAGASKPPAELDAMMDRLGTNAAGPGDLPHAR